MTGFAESVQELLRAEAPIAFAQFADELDAGFIELALRETGAASVRRRKIPAELVVWLVIGMAMFRDRSIQEVVNHLGLVLPKKGNGTAGGHVVPSAVPQARTRVGAAPIELIFMSTAEHWALPAAREATWRGLSLFGVDGTVLRVADTEENRSAFGLPGSGRGQAGYPQVRIVTLMALRSHLMAAAAIGPCRGKQTGELSLARELWSQVPENSLTVLDKLFLSHADLYEVVCGGSSAPNGNRHWLVRAKSNTKWTTVQRFGSGDGLVQIKPTTQARKANPDLPETLVVRAVKYQIKGFRPQWLLTSLVDAEAYPAKEVAGLYHERWELEVGYDEVKTHMLEREEALRSKTAEGTRQEVWGVLLAYNLIRRKILHVARSFGLQPNRISFRHSLQLIRVFCLVEAWTSAPGNLPRRLEGLCDLLSELLVLPPRRSERRYKRHVKIKMSPYKRNPGRPARYA